MKKTVVVIGAGPCGLAALKEQLQAGHDATAFEAAPQLGGVFASKTAYSHLRLTISNWMMAFSDFPDPSRLHYCTGEHYLQYMSKYARHFGLEKHITYNATVTKAEVNGAGKWKIEISKAGVDETMIVESDALIVATGANHYPRQPPACFDNYTGRILHSVDYSDALINEVAEKKLRVLVVGSGESGADMAADLSHASPNTVAVWLRRPILIGPRYLNPWSEIPQVEANSTRDFPANAFLEAATTNRMSAAQNVWFYGLYRRILWNTPFLIRTLSNMCLDGSKEAWFACDQASVVTKNQRMCEAVESGELRAVVAPDVSSSGKTLTLQRKDGTIAESSDFDLVLLCSGFQVSFPWLKVPDVLPNPRTWWLHCFPPNYGDKLFFVGFTRPHQGGIPACGEMLSRYIALLLRGDTKLPSNYAQLTDLDREAERKRYYLRPDLNTLVDYNSLMEGVARRIGCEPKLSALDIGLFNIHMASLFTLPWKPRASLAVWTSTLALFILRDDGRLIKWWFYPHWPVYYRQRGPGADPALLKKTMERVSLRKSTDLNERFASFVVWSVATFYVQRVLNLPVFLVDRVVGAFRGRMSKGMGAWLKPKMFGLHGVEWRFGDLFLP